MNGYKLLQRLGTGSFGRVWEAAKISTGQRVAVKEIDYESMSTKERQMLVNEVNILKTLQSKFIVRFLDHEIDKEKQRLYIVMEICTGGDLQTFIRETRARRETISEDQIWLTLSELSIALKECHGRPDKIVHRDIKPANVFIDDRGHVKLGDFGLAKALENDFTRTVCGTPFYMSPELCSHRQYDEKSDIWALGCVIYEMAARRAPFMAREENELRAIIKHDRPPRIPDEYSDALWHCILGMLEKDPNRRYSIDQVLQTRRVGITVKTIEYQIKRENLKRDIEKLNIKCENLEQRKKRAQLHLIHNENVILN